MTRKTTAAVFARALLGAVLVAAATAGALGTAAADPGDRPHPLLDTTCSLDQIDAALAERAPALAQRFAQHPEFRTRLGELLAVAPDQRRVMILQKRGEHSDRHEGGERRIIIQEGPEGGHAALTDVLEHCGSY
ncbi:hemophore-related protein [Nocardia thailandica]|uniref:hemophore-related protein n=1 Tax=Nocardia thailandica TaxID=257275 RepID=UPI0012F912F3|nr:hemophore-related protein [Nocardia thailandica]